MMQFSRYRGLSYVSGMQQPNHQNDPINPFTELCELRIRSAPETLSNEHSVRGTLKFDSMLWDFGGVEYRIGLSRAYLSLFLSGFQAKMGSGIGEVKTQNVEQTTEAVSSSDLGATLSLESGSLQQPISASAEVNAATKSGLSVSRKQSAVDVELRSLPNNRWEITSPNPQQVKKWIKSTVLNDDLICVIQDKPRSNTQTIQAEVHARKSDFEVDAVRGNIAFRRMRVYRNKEAIIGAIATKAIIRESARNSAAIDERVVLISRHLLEGF